RYTSGGDDAPRYGPSDCSGHCVGTYSGGRFIPPDPPKPPSVVVFIAYKESFLGGPTYTCFSHEGGSKADTCTSTPCGGACEPGNDSMLDDLSGLSDIKAGYYDAREGDYGGLLFHGAMVLPWGKIPKVAETIAGLFRAERDLQPLVTFGHGARHLVG